MEIPTGYAQANVMYSGPGVDGYAEVTLGLDVSGFPNTPNDAATAVYNAFASTDLLNALSASWSLEGVRVKFGPQATGPTGELMFSEAGTAATDSVVSNVAVLVQKVTAMGGRAGRGRLYMPGIVETQVATNGIITGTLHGYFDAGFTNLLSGLQTLNLDPVLLHAAGSPIGSPTPITAFVVQSKVATQRRRLRR